MNRNTSFIQNSGNRIPPAHARPSQFVGNHVFNNYETVHMIENKKKSKRLPKLETKNTHKNENQFQTKLPHMKGFNKTDSPISVLLCVLCFPKVVFLIFTSRKHTYIILTPLKPYFYLVKLGFTGVYIFFFLFLLKT